MRFGASRSPSHVKTSKMSQSYAKKFNEVEEKFVQSLVTRVVKEVRSIDM
jgi:hypothetical protein